MNAFEDIRVERVRAFASSCGKWEIVTAFPDFKVQIVRAFGDIKVSGDGLSRHALIGRRPRSPPAPQPRRHPRQMTAAAPAVI